MAGLSGGSTQEEVLAIALQKLELCPGDRVLDLGCGTGRVAVAVSGSAAEVIAIDRRPEAIECARRVSIEAGANNIIFFEGEAADLLPSLGSFDVAFVGGTRGLSGFLPVLVAEIRRLKAEG